jgi:superfamily II DNA/RNA helicase
MMLFKGGVVTTANSGVAINKLMQVASGCMYDNDKVAWEFDCQPRIDKMHEIIDQAISGTLVFTSFAHTLRRLERELVQRGFGVMHGGVSREGRKTVLQQFANGDLKGILAEASVMSHGITAVRADQTIWFGPPRSTEVYVQASNRMDRPGQTNPMFMAHLFGSKVERDRYNQISGNKEWQDDTLSLYRRFLDD